MSPKIDATSNFAALRSTVERQTRFYDRKSKHLRFDTEGRSQQVYLHRGFDGFGANVASRRAEQRSAAGGAVFEAIARDHGQETAERIFMAVTRSPIPQQALTLRDFKRISREVEALGPARTAAVLNGVTQEATLSAATQREIGTKVNRGITAAQQDPQSLEWGGAENAADPIRQNLAGSMLKELGKAEISLNGVLVSSSDEAAAGLHRTRNQQHSVRLSLLRARVEEDAGIPLQDMRTLSLVLNRSLLYTALERVNHQAGQPPFAVSFSPQPGTPDLEIHCRAQSDQPGRYQFTASLRQALRFVSDPNDETVSDRLDPAQSHYEISLAGTVDCNDAANPVTVEGGQMAYKAVPAE